MSRLVVWLALLVGLGLLCPAPSAQAGLESVERFELDNGLRVALHPLEGVDRVAVCVVYDVGENHDPEGMSGLGHLTEHCLMTCATSDRGVRPANKVMRAYRHGWNAQTGEDYTVIALVTEQRHLEREVLDAAARMGTLKIGAGDLAREVPRMVTELDNMYDVNGVLAAPNRARDLVRPAAEGARRGGIQAHLQALDAEDVRQHWERYYKPRNARLAIVGGFDPEVVRALVTDAFSGLPAGEPLPEPRPRRTPRRGVLERAALTPGHRGGLSRWAAVEWRAPDPDDPAFVPYLVLAHRVQLEVLKWAKRKHIKALRFVFAPLDDPQVFGLLRAHLASEEPEAVVAELRAIVAEAAERPLGLPDRAGARVRWMQLFELLPLPDDMRAANLYGAAFRLLRLDQMGLNGEDLAQSLLALTPEAYAAAMASLVGEGSSSAVVTFRPE